LEDGFQEVSFAKGLLKGKPMLSSCSIENRVGFGIGFFIYRPS